MPDEDDTGWTEELLTALEELLGIEEEDWICGIVPGLGKVAPA